MILSFPITAHPQLTHLQLAHPWLTHPQLSLSILRSHTLGLHVLGSHILSLHDLPSHILSVHPQLAYPWSHTLSSHVLGSALTSWARTSSAHTQHQSTAKRVWRSGRALWHRCLTLSVFLEDKWEIHRPSSPFAASCMHRTC